MSRHILVVDDDTTLLQLMQDILQRENYEVSIAKNGLEGLQSFYKSNPELVILDVMMPDMDGWTVCARIREMSNVPIIMLTGLNSDVDIERGLELGADNYLVKPITASELMARVKATFRRTNHTASPVSPDAVISYNGLQIDTFRHVVSFEGTPIHLTPTEFKLLVCLAEHRGRILPHNYILERVWGAGYEENRDILRLYIQKLRSKLKQATGMTEIIQAHWGIGYRFD